MRKPASKCKRWPQQSSGLTKSKEGGVQMMSEYWFYYEDGEGLIRIKAKRRPGPSTRPTGHCWKLQEDQDGIWITPCFPEITWRMLREMHFVKKELAI